MKPIQLKADGQGNVILQPLQQWGVAPVADTVLILALEYLQGEPGKTPQVQQADIALTPQQALDLAEALETAAKIILTPDRKPKQ